MTTAAPPTEMRVIPYPSISWYSVMPESPSARIAGQSRSGGSLIKPAATGTTSTADAIRKRRSESSAGVNAWRP